MTIIDTTDTTTDSVTCSCCAPAATADVTEAVSATPSAAGCTCRSGDSAGCGSDCACGTAS